MPHDDLDLQPGREPPPEITYVDPKKERALRAMYDSQEQPQRWGRFILIVMLAVGVLFGFVYARQKGWFSDPVPEGYSVRVGTLTVSIKEYLADYRTTNGVRATFVEAWLGNGTKEPIDAPEIKLSLIDAGGARHAPTQSTGEYKSGTPLNPNLEQSQLWYFHIDGTAVIERLQFETPDGSRGEIKVVKWNKKIDDQLQVAMLRRLKLDAEAAALEARLASKSSAGPRAGLEEAKRPVKAPDEIIAPEDARKFYEEAKATLADLQAQEDRFLAQRTKLRKSAENLQDDLAARRKEAELQAEKVERAKAVHEEFRTANARNPRQDSQFTTQMNQAAADLKAAQAKQQKILDEIKRLEQALAQAKADAVKADTEAEAATYLVKTQVEEIRKWKEIVNKSKPVAPQSPPPQD